MKEWLTLNSSEHPHDQVHVFEVDGERKAVVSWFGGHAERPDHHHALIRIDGKQQTRMLSELLSEAKEEVELMLGTFEAVPDPRPETGPLQFGEDWPGTFIRGDASFHYQIQLNEAIELLDAMPDPGGLSLVFLKQLRDLLASSEVGKGTPIKLKAFKACQD